MKGFNTGSLIHFVLGFLGKKRDDVVIGAYDKISDKFYIDYNNILYQSVKVAFLTKGLKLNIVKANGMGFDDFVFFLCKLSRLV